jgi:hypothetical protein
VATLAGVGPRATPLVSFFFFFFSNVDFRLGYLSHFINLTDGRGCKGTEMVIECSLLDNVLVRGDMLTMTGSSWEENIIIHKSLTH